MGLSGPPLFPPLRGRAPPGRLRRPARANNRDLARKRYTASYARGVALCPPLTRRASAPLARPDTTRKRPYAAGGTLGGRRLRPFAPPPRPSAPYSPPLRGRANDRGLAGNSEELKQKAIAFNPRLQTITVVEAAMSIVPGFARDSENRGFR